MGRENAICVIGLGDGRLCLRCALLFCRPSVFQNPIVDLYHAAAGAAFPICHIYDDADEDDGGGDDNDDDDDDDAVA